MTRPEPRIVRIAVTGIGLVSPLASGARATFARLARGERAFREARLFDTSALRAHLAGEIELPAPEQARGPGWSRTAEMALLAAREALEGLALAPERGGLAFATSTSGMLECELTLAELAEASTEAIGRLASHPTGSVAERLDEALGPFRVRRTLCSACSAGSNAIATGAAWLAAGRADWVLAGAADGLSLHTFGGFEALSAMSAEPSRPFDRARAGMSMGEAGAFLVLEREEDARARGHAALGWLAGWAIGCEALHITQPEETGETVARLVRDALARAELRPEDVDYVHAHGTGTPRNDPNELLGLRKALGAHRPLVSSSKGAIGHTLAAAGAVGAALTLVAMEERIAPPTVGLEDVDPECDAAHVLGAAAPARIDAALVDAFGFGGMDTVLALTATARGGAAAPSHDVVISGVGVLSPHGLHDAEGLAALLAAGLPRGEGSAPVPQTLDATRSRRFDRSSRRLTLAALAARPTELGAEDPETGLVAGNACGAIDETAAYCKKWSTRRGKSPDPITFPALVPSSPAARAAIYLGLKGPVFSAHDLGMAGEEAALAAHELVASGAAGAMVGGAYDELGPLLEGVYRSALSYPRAFEAPASDGAAAVLFEARVRAAHPLTRVTEAVSSAGPLAPPAPPTRPRCVVVRAHRRAPLPDGWAAARELVAADVFGSSDAAGCQALALGAVLASKGESVLVTHELDVEPGHPRAWRMALEPTEP